MGSVSRRRVLFGLEIVALLTILAFALSLRVFDLEGARSSFPDLFDEGIRAEQLLLMRHGFRPFRDIYASQGPLLLDLLYPPYMLLGGTLGAARLTVGLLSVVGVAGIYWTARVMAGPLAGLLAAVLLVVSPVYLEASRLALAEVPSIVPVIVALGAAVSYQRSGARAWLIASAVLLAVGVLVKPMVIGAVLPVTAAVLLRKGIRMSDVLWYVGTSVGTAAAVIAFLGPADVYEQIVVYRLGSRANDTWDMIKNWDEVVREPARAFPAFVTLGALGALASLLLGRRGIPVALFVGSMYLVLFAYTSLHPKHQVYLVPPLALAGGVGVASLLSVRGSSLPRLVAGAGAAVLGILAAGTLVQAPDALARGTTLVDEDVDPDLHVYDREVAATLRALISPEQFVLSDHPYLPYLAGRMVPPEMVDPSKGRFRAGVLTSEMVVQSATRRDVTTVLFWADRFRRLTEFSQWVEERYRAIHILGPRVLKGRDGKDRSIYVRDDADTPEMAANVAASLPISFSAQFGGDLQLAGARVGADTATAGAGFPVTLYWRAVQRVSADYNMVVAMEGEDGQIWAAQQLDLDGLDRGAPWPPGRWLLRSAMLTPEAGTSPGTYQITVSILQPRSGPLRVVAGDDGIGPRVLDDNRLVIGSMTVVARDKRP